MAVIEEFEKVQRALDFIRTKTDIVPETGVILGTGLDRLADNVQERIVIPYEEIPYFPVSTLKEHPGNLVIGRVGKKKVVVMQGRFHCYEGYTSLQTVLPVRVMKFLGVNTLLESNVSGGLNPLFERGDMVIITDHINLMGQSPLSGPNDERFGIRFPDMSRAYDASLVKIAEKIALGDGLPVKKGVLLALPGPNLETPAEYRFLRLIGADMVCMSTVPEVIAAVHLDMRVFGISVITDMCLPDALNPVSIEEIVGIANAAEPKLTKLMEKIIIQS